MSIEKLLENFSIKTLVHSSASLCENFKPISEKIGFDLRVWDIKGDIAFWAKPKPSDDKGVLLVRKKQRIYSFMIRLRCLK